MDECIDRKTLINNLELLARHEDRFRRCVILGVVETIRAMKAADVATVVHGRWLKEEKETYCPIQYGEDGEPILHKYTRYICSLCGRNSGMLEPYCHCGAKMDGGADDDTDGNV